MLTQSLVRRCTPNAFPQVQYDVTQMSSYFPSESIIDHWDVRVLWLTHPHHVAPNNQPVVVNLCCNLSVGLAEAGLAEIAAGSTADE